MLRQQVLHVQVDAFAGEEARERQSGAGVAYACLGVAQEVEGSPFRREKVIDEGIGGWIGHTQPLPAVAAPRNGRRL